MLPAQVLSTVGLIKTSRRRGFCPACRLFQTGEGPQEIAAPGLIALAFLIVAGLAWAFSIERMSSMDDMAMGLGSFGPFVASWSVMMAAMMLPSAMPLVFEFAQVNERRQGWLAATALLGATYLGVWLAFGVVCYLLYYAAGMPWRHQEFVGGAALVIAGLYAFTPVKRASEAYCRERCALHGPLPFNLMRSAVVAGARYGLSCLGCSAGLMVAMVLIGMANLVWMIVLAAVVLVYKVGPAPTPRTMMASSGMLVAFGVLYAVAG
jgi:predicted metal-binding membrane protein